MGVKGCEGCEGGELEGSARLATNKKRVEGLKGLSIVRIVLVSLGSQLYGS
jgi:hypothetical protein